MNNRMKLHTLPIKNKIILYTISIFLFWNICNKRESQLESWLNYYIYCSCAQWSGWEHL